MVTAISRDHRASEHRRRDAGADRLGQAPPPGNTCPGRHVLQDDGGRYRKEDGPEQGGTVTGPGGAGRHDGARADERGRYQQPRSKSESGHGKDLED